MTNIWDLIKGLGITIGGAIVFSGNSAIAKVNLDGNLSNNFGVATQESIRILKGGTQSESNLSHNFKKIPGKHIVLATCCLEGEICIKCKP
ncbi:hypothetical protein [uncultured Nostoc sp.]|uniref:hypothetical protein n=1 Tax=uncultured Nostoc sp. TaxID=340711 RepID=UPI0026131129|nr:hypothetical protein [uncultured Nostoc sp.]